MTLGEAFTGLSYLVGAAVFLWAARRRRLATEGMAIVAGVGFVAGIVGAKLTQVVASGLPLRAVANPGGRALLGGLAFGWIGVELAKRRMGIRRSTGDLFALALPAGEALGRIGCYFNGCCYGARWEGFGAVWQHGAWRYPSQLLSSAVAAATFAGLWWLSRVGFCTDFQGPCDIVGTPSPTVPPSAHVEGWPTSIPSLRGGKGNHLRSLREGDLFRVYLLVFGVTRFGLEFVRWRESTVAGLSPMQWFCLDLIVVALVGLLKRRKDGLPQLRPGV